MQSPVIDPLPMHSAYKYDSMNKECFTNIRSGSDTCDFGKHMVSSCPDYCFIQVFLLNYQQALKSGRQGFPLQIINPVSEGYGSGHI